MAKISASILVLLALFAFVGAEQFQTINFDQGSLRFRSLDTASTLKSFDFVNITNSTAANVSLGDAYNTKAGIDTTKTFPTMMLFLHHSTTGFCTGCREHVNYKCPSNDCNADTTKPQQLSSATHPYYYVSKGSPFTQPVTIGADATAWELKTSALLSDNVAMTYFRYPGQSMMPYYIQTYDTYGYIGLGVDGDSAKNFAGDHPIFSINVTGAGTGKLIFGKDTTLIDSAKTSQSLTTDTNWTMVANNISLGASTYWKPFPATYSSYNLNTTVIFDVNFPGLGIPSDSYAGSMYDGLITNLTAKHNTETVEKTDKVQYNTTTYENSLYPYIYKGDITQLSSIVIGLANGQNFTIPPQAYTKKIAEGIYNILINPTSAVYNSDTRTYNNWFILGSSFMSNYYTVFEKTATGNPTVTLNPNFATASTGTTTTTASSWKTIFIVIVVVLVALVVLSLAFKKKNNLTKSDLGVELRAARV